jgi:arabinogalactan endo-1,4-beta-galactosidase
MKNRILAAGVLLLGLLSSPARTAAQTAPHTLPFENDYAFGLDVSFTRQHEDNGRKYYDTDGAEKRPLQIFRDHGVMPDVVQIGNEIGNGFLWPDGRIFYDTPEKSEWKKMTDYLKAGARAIREAAGGDHRVKIMLHVDHGGDIPMTQTFFDKMAEYGVDYDMIGFSFYPWSHGTLLDLKNNLHFTANRYGREIILIETGYYFQPSHYFRDVRPPFAETPQGQREWLEAVNEIVLGTPNGLGRGIFWWEPMMRGRGYFDAENRIQPIIHALEKYALPVTRADGQTRIQ